MNTGIINNYNSMKTLSEFSIFDRKAHTRTTKSGKKIPVKASIVKNKERNKLLNQSVAQAVKWGTALGLSAAVAVPGRKVIGNTLSKVKLGDSLSKALKDKKWAQKQYDQFVKGSDLGKALAKNRVPQEIINTLPAVTAAGLLLKGTSSISEIPSKKLRNLQRDAQGLDPIEDRKNKKFRNRNLAEFRRKLTEEEQERLKRLGLGGGYITAGGYLTKKAIDSGVPRMLGVRLERHATSKDAAKQILTNKDLLGKSGELDPSKGGTMEGITKKMKLPEHMQQKSKGYSFISGMNSEHPIIQAKDLVIDPALKEKFANSPRKLAAINLLEDSALSAYNVGVRKFQVAGYGGAASMNKPITDAELEGITRQLNSQIKTTKATYAALLDNAAGGIGDSSFLAGLVDPEDIPTYTSKEYMDNWKEVDKEAKKAIADFQNKNKISDNVLKKKFTVLDNLKTRKNPFDVSDYMKMMYGGFTEVDKNLPEDVSRKIGKRIFTDGVGMDAVYGTVFAQRATSPSALARSKISGAELFVPGTDDYFNNTDRFKFDPDDPFPTRGYGTALKTKDKVKVFSNRWHATTDLLKQQGDGNMLKGANKLIKANKKRVAAGVAILGLGGLAGGALLNEGKNILNDKQESNNPFVKVKRHFRNVDGKSVLVNPFKYKKKDKKFKRPFS